MPRAHYFADALRPEEFDAIDCFDRLIATTEACLDPRDLVLVVEVFSEKLEKARQQAADQLELVRQRAALSKL